MATSNNNCNNKQNNNRNNNKQIQRSDFNPTKIQKTSDSKEIQAMTQDLIDVTAEGYEACDELDLLMDAAEEAAHVSEQFRTRRYEARQKLMALAINL